MSSYSSIRSRCGSVGRGEASRDTGFSSYRSSYTPRDLPKPTTRMSRASSYDPFSSRSSMSTSMTTYNRPSYSSNYSSSSMSHSYHPDYTSKNLTNRYGSSEQLNFSSPYKSSYTSSVGSKFRPSEAASSSTRERSTYRASSTFSPRTPNYSDTRSNRDFTPSTRDYGTSSLSKYRPESSTYGGISSYSRPSSSYSASNYTPRVRFEYRSKTPGVSATSNTDSTRLSRYDREYRSMGRIEKKPVSDDEKSADEVEATFQKLYNRYVKDVDDEIIKTPTTQRKFISHSDDEASSDEEQSPSETDDSYMETKSACEMLPSTLPSLTPRVSPCEKTPLASPKMPKKNFLADIKTLPKEVETAPKEVRFPSVQPTSSKSIESTEIASSKEQSNEPVQVQTSPSIPSTATPPKSSKQIFEETHGDVDMKPAIIPTRTLKPAASAMDKFLKKDNLANKLTDAIEKKKVEPPKSQSPSPASALKGRTTDSKEATASSLVSTKPSTNKSTSPVTPSTSLSVSDKISKSLSPAPSSAACKVSPSNVTKPPSAFVDKNKTTTSSGDLGRSSLSPVSPVPSSNSKEKEKSSNSTISKPAVGSKSPSPMVTKTKPALTIDVKAAEEPTTDVTIVVPKRSLRSRSSSPAGSIRREQSPQYLAVEGRSSKMRRSASPSHDRQMLTVERDDRAHSEDTSDKKHARKKRDPTRTLENLKEKLEIEQKKTENSESIGTKDATKENKTTVRPPLLLVTQPSMPSTPTILHHNDDYSGEEEFSDAEWTEADDEEDFESDIEYTISQTFKIPDRLPMGDLYPLRSPDSSRCSPFVSDYDSDNSVPFLVTDSRAEDSRGRVHRLFAVPPPTFTCSVSYDGQESWDSEEGSVHSCQEYEDTYKGRITSSGLSYITPSEDESIYDEDSIAVGCTLKLVDRAAMRDEDDYTDDSEYYDDEEEYTDEEYWDEDEEYEYEDEEEVSEFADEECSEDEMYSLRDESPELVAYSADQREESVELEEADSNFEVATTFVMALPKEVSSNTVEADKNREITYTKDMLMATKVEEAGHLELEQDESAKAKAKRIMKDGTTEKAGQILVPQQVAPAMEVVPEASLTELDSETIMELDLLEVTEDLTTNEVNVVPTFVKEQTEKVTEESTSRFSERKPSTDFAKKAVIQPNKLETAKVQKVETKVAEIPKKPSPSPTPAPTVDNKKASTSSTNALPKTVAATTKVEGKNEVSKPSSSKPTATSTTAKPAPSSTTISGKAVETAPTFPSKEVEDKSGIRKSALNMNTEDAKKKAKADEEAAKIKARRFGTVSALMDKFKEEPKEPEKITYKRSSRLTQNEDQRPRRKYEVIKPVINDEFDKQMEEIRAQMKAGSSQFQNEIKNLSKGISSVSEEAKKRELEEKHKILIDKTSGVFSEADKEKMRWKERRDAETEAELARIEASKGSKHQKQAAPEPTPVEQPKKEPKRTVRKIIRDKSPAVPKDQSSIPAQGVATPAAASAASAKAGGRTPAPPPAPKVPAMDLKTPAQIGVKTIEKKTPTVDVKPAASNVEAANTTSGTTAAPAPPAVSAARDMFRREKTPVVKPADTMQKPSAPKSQFIVDDSNFDLLQAATQVATRRRKSIVEMKQQKEKSKTDLPPPPPPQSTSSSVVTNAASSPSVPGIEVPTPAASKTGPKGDGAAATKIRNALGNMGNINDMSKSPAGSEKGSSRRYGARRRTQEIVNESHQPKRRRREKSRKNRYIKDPHDIDVILGWDKENTFEQMEQMFQRESNQKMNTSESSGKKRKRVEISSKIWISELMDIDKIYKPSEIRDIAASVDM